MISGTEVRKPASSALHMVEMAGELKEVWRKVILCAMVACGVHGTAMYNVCNIAFDACA